MSSGAGAASAHPAGAAQGFSGPDYCAQHSHCACLRSCTTEGGQDDLKKGTQLLEIYALEIQVKPMSVHDLHWAVLDKQ